MVLMTGDVDIDATRSEVLEVLADLADYPTWSDVHKKVTVDSRTADGRPERATMAVAAVGLTDEQELDYSWQGNGMTWSLRRSGMHMQRAQHGRYVVTQQGPHDTHVHYELEIDPLVPLPGLIVRQVMKKAVACATQGLKARVEHR